MVKKIIAALLIAYGIFGLDFLKYIPVPTPPHPEPVVILNVDKPSQEVIDSVKGLSSVVTDPSDRAKIAIFNYEFATKVKGYETNLQQVNDVYTLAGKTFFKEELVGKYKGLGDAIIKLISKLVSDNNHDLTQTEKDQISEHFMGLSWSLLQKE
jgi:hypothetical protein